MFAPEKFALWLDANEHVDRRYGHIYRYHSRSDAHSIALCRLVLDDLLANSSVLSEHATAGTVAFGINVSHEFSSGKRKTLDLALGIPSGPVVVSAKTGLAIGEASSFNKLLLSCEAKSVMTEHSKSQPRVFDELSSSHEIVHRDSPESIAAGITVVNIAQRFVSPLRQKHDSEVHVSEHKQPHVAQRMIQHLRGLRTRNHVGEVGFDAYCTIVVDCENTVDAPVRLITADPAPQPSTSDHYDSFLRRLVKLYETRFPNG